METFLVPVSTGPSAAEMFCRMGGLCYFQPTYSANVSRAHATAVQNPSGGAMSLPDLLAIVSAIALADSVRTHLLLE